MDNTIDLGQLLTYFGIFILIALILALIMLAGVFPAHPTFSELSILASRAAR